MIHIRLLALLLLVASVGIAQPSLPLRGLAIEAPGRQDVSAFVKFIHDELAPRGVNTLILRVDYKYQYKSHPSWWDTMP